MIFNPVIVKGGIKLPELTNPGTAADLLAPKQLIDAEGNALTGTIATKTASDLTASGATVTAPAGYYASAASKSIATAAQATPSITVSSAGLITASATQTAGYVAAGTKSATKQLTTKAAATITPGTANQTIASGQYLTGTQTIKGDANLLAANIKSGVSLFGVAGSYEGCVFISGEVEYTSWQSSITIAAAGLSECSTFIMVNTDKQLSSSGWTIIAVRAYKGASGWSFCRMALDNGVNGYLYGTGSTLSSWITVTGDSLQFNEATAATESIGYYGYYEYVAF